MQSEHKEPTGGSHNLKILLIDDMKSLTLLLQAGLQQRGYTVLAAFSGREGIEIFDKEVPDITICDMGMEEMNGLEVSRAIGEMCEEKGIPRVPFLLLTGWGAALEEEALAHTGVDRVIAKPVEVSVLARIVQEVVEST